MQFRLLKMRFRRRLRKGARTVGDIGQQTEAGIEKHFFNRFERLIAVRRFVIGWLLLVVLLITSVLIQNSLLGGYYQTFKPVPGGIYNEGVLGTFTGANPMYASSDADRTVSSLIFEGLLKYDSHNNLVGALAKDYSVDNKGMTYTVHLKPNLKWQDGAPLTSADVVFTFKSIQNPDAKSPLISGWQGIEITAPDSQTVQFKLPNVLASFPYTLTTGIVPKHLLEKTTPSDLRTADFNTILAVGAGPFKLQTLKVYNNDPAHAQERLVLIPNENYYAGKPKLDEFIVHVFADESQLVDAFRDGQLTGLEGLTGVPDKLKKKVSLRVNNFLLTAGTYVFFKTSQAPFDDASVRRALVQAADQPAVLRSLGYPTRAVKSPFLQGQLGYDGTLVQPGFDPAAAARELDQAGWVVGKDGVRSKNGKPLAFTLTVKNTDEYRRVADILRKNWQKIGAKADIRQRDDQDFQTALTFHDYDAVLYGISIGPDPDVFVYWESTQADIRSANRLNLSEYKNAAADASLAAGRTRLDPSLRAVKYKGFLQAWQKDLPAAGLYQPRLMYLTNGEVFGLDVHPINTATDRFKNVSNWQIRQARVTNRL